MANVVITGANRGIGLALVKHYLSAGNHVVALCRKSSPELISTGAEVVDGVDVCDLTTLEGLADKVRPHLKGNSAIDVLINNAGVLHHESIGSFNYDTMVQQVQVNALGPVMVTQELLELLIDGSKLAMITSRMGSMADNGSGGYYGYRMSKAALNAASVSFARDLEARGIAVAVLHPGFVQTDMVGGAGNISPEEAALGLANRITELNLTTTGSFKHSDGQDLPW